MNPCIFLSHRSTDKEIADMLRDFLVGVGIPNELIFCSSLPGNDVVQRIALEVKKHLQNSVVNICILSHDYYESAYCLNEAGIIWFQEKDTIIIALPEIESSNLYGFFSLTDNKLRRLNSTSDIASIYDIVRCSIGAKQASGAVTDGAIQKLISRYTKYIDARTVAMQNNAVERKGGIDLLTAEKTEQIIGEEKQKFIELIDQNLLKAKTLLPITLKYALRSSLITKSLNEVHVDRFVSEFHIDRFDANNQAAVKISRMLSGQASSACKEIIVPFSHSYRNELNEYEYSVLDGNTQHPMMYSFDKKNNIEMIRIGLPNKAKKSFNILLSIEDNSCVPSFCDENKVQAFLVDPNLLFSNWDYTQILFHSNDERIKNRIGRLFFVSRNNYSWEHIDDKSFDSKGVLQFEISADDMEEYKDCICVVLLER